jgi:hypothetical protein
VAAVFAATTGLPATTKVASRKPSTRFITYGNLGLLAAPVKDI